MKKTSFSMHGKRIMALMLAAALAIPAAVGSLQAVSAEETKLPEALMTVNFDKGIKGETTKNGLNVVPSAPVLQYTHKDTTITAGYEYKYEYFLDKPFFDGTPKAYKYAVMGNQPSTCYDAVKGAVLWMQEDKFVDKFVKEKLVDYTVGDDGNWIAGAKPDEAAALDTAAPVGKVLQEAYTGYPEVAMNNPYKGISGAAGLTANYWIKLTADPNNAAKAENTVVLGFKDDAAGVLQIMADGTAVYAPAAGEDGSYSEANSFYQAGKESVLTDTCKPEEWHMVTAVFSDTGIALYYDGKAAEAGGTKGSAAGLLAWLAGENVTATVGGAAEDLMKLYSVTPNVTAYCLDDLTFYNSVLPADQITALYDAGAAEIAYAKNADKPIPEPIGTITFDSKDKFSVDLTSNKTTGGRYSEPELATDATMGNVLHTFKSVGTETSAAKLANPFAGKELKGATVAYWMKSGDKESTLGISFADAPKLVSNSKVGVSGEGSSLLYADTKGTAYFVESDTNSSVGDKVQNSFGSALSDADATALRTNNTGTWHFYTVTITNQEIKYYVDGNLLKDENVNKGARFCDGYYVRMTDTRSDNLTYGGSNNQGATAVTDFLSYTDTDMYVAYGTNKSSRNFQACQEAWFGDILCYDEAFDGAQVTKLYTQENEKHGGGVMLGDVNGDTDITSKDALMILQHAAQIITLEGAQYTAANVVKDNTVNSKDALEVLRYSAHMITDFGS